MKVLYLIPTTTKPGRLAPYTFIDEEIEGLADAGIEPYVLSTTASEDYRHGRVRVLAAAPGNWVSRAKTLAFAARNVTAVPSACLRHPRQCIHALRMEQWAAEVIRRNDIDLIHGHFGAIIGLGGLVARAETGRPLVTSFRGMDLLIDREINYGLRRDPFYDSAVRALLRGLTHSTYASEFMRRKGVELGANASTATVITKGVDTERFSSALDREQVRKELGLSGPVVFSVATRLGRRKGVDHTLRALARLRDTHEFTFVICGDSPERARLEDLSRELSIEDRVRFVGLVSREEIPKYFAACDVFVLASLLEAAGNVVLEAMASGRPVVCTDSGGPPEYVRDGKTGFVVPVADPERMAARIKMLLDDEGLREAFGREGRRIAEQQLPYGQMIASYLNVYRDALSATEGPGLGTEPGRRSPRPRRKVVHPR